MPAHNIVIGQKVNSAKVQQARILRRQMTPEEKTLWPQLRANKLNEEVRNNLADVLALIAANLTPYEGRGLGG